MKVQQTNTEKDLGILIDNKLNFCDHVDKIVFGANQIVGLTRHLICSLDKDIPVFVLLFKTLLRPKFEYNNTVWNLTPNMIILSLSQCKDVHPKCY